MMTRIHTADNLYNFIQNARQMENLDAQIASKEEELKYLDQLDEIYAKLFNPAPFDTARQYTKVALELTLLKLKRNKLERKILEFELGTFLEN
jgi:hypothetical protein